MKEDMQELIVVVVLNFNGLKDTIACLETLVPQRCSGIEILVVDNASAEDPSGAIEQRFGDVPVLRLAENKGWAGGNNAGIAWARARGADMVCLLNNDTLLPAGSIGRLAGTVRLVGPCLLHPAIDFAEPGAGAQLDPSRWTASPRLRGHENIYVLGYAYGACLVVPVSVFDRIGVFDERFFLQLEESDFYERARSVGIQSLCLPEIRIIHTESSSFGGKTTPLKTYYIWRNTLLLSQKHDRNMSRRFQRARELYWGLTYLACHRLGKSPSTGRTMIWGVSGDPFAKAIRQGIRDYVRKRFGRMDPARLG